MWCFDDWRIVRLTPRGPVARAVALVTRERVLRALAETQGALERMGIATPRIAVAGLNPHAGEGGLFGDEDGAAIAPAIDAAQASGIKASGPFGADTMLRLKTFDAFIVMLHDQGDVAVSILAQHGASRLVIGTPVPYCAVAPGGTGAEPIVAAVRLLVGPARRQAA
jgi:4-hydroxy-L-threonine phosphate dehydrogenase PdxA